MTAAPVPDPAPTPWLLVFNHINQRDIDPDAVASDTLPQAAPDSAEVRREFELEYRLRAPAERKLIRVPDPSPALLAALEEGGDDLEALVWGGLEGERVEVLLSDTAWQRWSVGPGLGELPPPTD